MQELIDRVARATGLEPERAERAVGITLSLIRKQGNRQKVDELFAKLPGAERLAAGHGEDGGGKGGFLGALGGLVGGPLAGLAKLQAAGLDARSDKNARDRGVVLCRGQSRAKIVREVTSSIPGLSRYL